MINQQEYERVMQGKKKPVKPQDYRRRGQAARGFKAGELVWIVKRCGNASTKVNRVPGKIKDVLETRFWVEYMVGDTVHLNKYYLHQLERRGNNGKA